MLRLTALVLFVLTSVASTQTVLFEEDFDAGLPAGWTKQQLGSTGDNWTVGFGLVNGTGDMNHEWFCNFGFQLRNNILWTPPLNLIGVSHATLSFDQWHEVFGTLVGIQEFNRVVVKVGNGAFTQLYEQPESPEPSGFSSVSLSLDAWAGLNNVRLGFQYGGVIGNDWSIDNVRVTSVVWEDLGHALAGGGGPPALSASGPLTPVSPIEIQLTGAAPSATAYLVVGFTELNFAPFYGGTLVPAFELPLGTFFTLGTDGAGALPIAATWPVGVPSGFELILQYWIVDAGAPFGLAATNAVKGTVP